jgi:hypothetical protein
MLEASKPTKFLWSKHPKTEELTLNIIHDDYKEKVNLKSVNIGTWEEIAESVRKLCDLPNAVQCLITGTSIRSFYRNLKKNFIEYKERYFMTKKRPRRSKIA